jgi:hypothetical protein
MQIDVDKSVGRLGKIADTILNKNPAIANGLADCQLRIGPATNSRYGSDTGALACPTYVGDSYHLRKTEYSPDVASLAKTNPKSVGMTFSYNNEHKKYDIKFSKILVNDSFTGDSLIGAQTLTPWSVNWFKEIFRQPLIWSVARKFVEIETGTDPWAEVMSLPMNQYSGFASLGNAGSPANVKTQDVEIQTGMMTAPIINMDVTYKLSVEELKRMETSQAPWAGSMIPQKQAYANWALEMLTDYLIYYGNSGTGTIGLFTVNTPTAWSSIGPSLSVTYADAGNTGTAGQTMYKLFAMAIRSFLNNTYNKVNKVMVGMSPLAYNLFSSVNYSNTYNPQSALKTFMDNFLAGEKEDGLTPDIEVFPEPLFSANSVFNPLATDYMTITAPEIGTGPDSDPQPLVRFGAPLMEFVYPVIPGQFMTQYRMLRRVAGVYAPWSPAVQVYTGFGI